MVLYVDWSWLNNLYMNGSKLNWSIIFLPCKVGIEPMCMYSYILSNDQIEWINLKLNMDQDELREVIDYRSCVPFILGLWGEVIMNELLRCFIYLLHFDMKS